MKCPICGGKMAVGRVIVAGMIVIRYRYCKNCGHSRKTIEE